MKTNDEGWIIPFTLKLNIYMSLQVSEARRRLNRAQEDIDNAEWIIEELKKFKSKRKK